MPDTGNAKPWLLALAGAVLSLLLGAIVVWQTLPLAFPDWTKTGTGSEPVTLTGRDLEPALAIGVVGDRAVLSSIGLGERDMVHRAYLRVDAAAYTQLRLSLDTGFPRTPLFLFWRTAEAPEGIHASRLDPPYEETSWHTLAARADWSGTIVELAVGTAGVPGGNPLEVRELSLHGSTPSALGERLWWQWTGFRPWSLSSLNKYPGAGEDVLVHPAAVACSWAVLSLFLVSAWLAWIRAPRRIVAAMLLLVLFGPWLCLDRLWQSQLERQLAATRATYGGLAQSEKHLREPDAPWQRYAAHLRNVLPDERGTRLFLLHDSSGHNYLRLRMQFHLLPYNVFNFGKELRPAEEMRPGDYVLVLGELGGLRFDAVDGVLIDEDRSLPARLVDRHELGRLYLLEEGTGERTGEAGRQ